MPDTKQVFQWRKEEKLDEAIALARHLLAQDPHDPWVIWLTNGPSMTA